MIQMEMEWGVLLNVFMEQECEVVSRLLYCLPVGVISLLIQHS